MITVCLCVWLLVYYYFSLTNIFYYACLKPNIWYQSHKVSSSKKEHHVIVGVLQPFASRRSKKICRCFVLATIWVDN
jgi:hypothetical protein